MRERKRLTLGTRGSVLALRQATMVQEKIQYHFPDIKIDLEIIKTSGDKIKDKPLVDVGGKGLFTKELDEKLLSGDIDLAVHSMKDVETFRPASLDVFGYLERHDPQDVLISSYHKKFQDLPKGAKIGTCSPRRSAQVLSHRPDLKIVPMRGNIDTRLQKLSAGACDALILAYAGFQRLQLTSCVTEIFDPCFMIPAIAQGVIGVEVRQEDHFLRKILEKINHVATARCVEIERGFLKGFEGDCRTAIAGWAHEQNNEMVFEGIVFMPQGEAFLKKKLQGSFEELVVQAFQLGQEFKIWYQTQPQTIM